MQKFGYPISLAGIVGGLMLPNDILEIVTVVAENWPIMQALLPWLGVMMAVGFGTWFLMMLSRDVPRGLRKRRDAIKMRRDAIELSLARTMTMVAENLEWYFESGADSFPLSTQHVQKSEGHSTRVRLAMEALENANLMPLPQEKMPNGSLRLRYRDAANFLYRTIPVVEEQGIGPAQKIVTAMNEHWKKQPIPDVDSRRY